MRGTVPESLRSLSGARPSGSRVVATICFGGANTCALNLQLRGKWVREGRNCERALLAHIPHSNKPFWGRPTGSVHRIRRTTSRQANNRVRIQETSATERDRMKRETLGKRQPLVLTSLYPCSGRYGHGAAAGCIDDHSSRRGCGGRADQDRY